MVHEVMVLDHSGPDLAFILYGSAVKLMLFSALLVELVLPLGRVPGSARVAVLGAGLLGVAALVGVVESVTARLRLSRIPQLLVGASVLAAFGSSCSPHRATMNAVAELLLVVTILVDLYLTSTNARLGMHSGRRAAGGGAVAAAPVSRRTGPRSGWAPCRASPHPLRGHAVPQGAPHPGASAQGHA